MIRNGNGDVSWRTLAAIIAAIVGLLAITGTVGGFVLKAYQIEGKAEVNCRDIGVNRVELKELRTEANSRLRAVETNQREVLSDVRWIRRTIEAKPAKRP